MINRKFSLQVIHSLEVRKRGQKTLQDVRHYSGTHRTHRTIVERWVGDSTCITFWFKSTKVMHCNLSRAGQMFLSNHVEELHVLYYEEEISFHFHF